MINISKIKRGMAIIALSNSAFFSLTMNNSYAIYCSNCSTVYQQMRQYVEDVNTQINTARQLQTQLQQYQDMIKQGVSFNSPQFEGLKSTLQQLNAAYQDGQSLSRNMGNINQEFSRMYPGYDQYLKTQGITSNDYKKWAQSGLDNSRIAIQAAGINTSTFDSEDQLMNKLINRSTTAEGRMQAIQAGNEISAQQVKQLQLLRDLMANNITFQSNYTTNEIERKAKEDAAEEKFFSQKSVNTNSQKGF